MGGVVCVCVCVRVVGVCVYLRMIDLCETHCRVGSLGGAAHLPIDNAGVPRCAECVQKSKWDQRVKRLASFSFSVRILMCCCVQHVNTTTMLTPVLREFFWVWRYFLRCRGNFMRC